MEDVLARRVTLGFSPGFLAALDQRAKPARELESLSSLHLCVREISGKDRFG